VSCLVALLLPDLDGPGLGVFTQLFFLPSLVVVNLLTEGQNYNILYNLNYLWSKKPKKLKYLQHLQYLHPQIPDLHLLSHLLFPWKEQSPPKSTRLSTRLSVSKHDCSLTYGSSDSLGTSGVVGFGFCLPFPFPVSLTRKIVPLSQHDCQHDCHYINTIVAYGSESLRLFGSVVVGSVSLAGFLVFLLFFPFFPARGFLQKIHDCQHDCPIKNTIAGEKYLLLRGLRLRVRLRRHKFGRLGGLLLTFSLLLRLAAIARLQTRLLYG